jgi:antitoxin ParD1/3/4
MEDTSTISVELTAELGDIVQRALSTGEYANGSEVVRDALLQWQVWRNAREIGADELRQLWDAGIDSGPGRLGDMEAIKREARRRFALAPLPRD